MSHPPSSAHCGGLIDRVFAQNFSIEWIASWNSHDLVRILRHYADDFEMFSPIIIDRMKEPTGVLRGKEAISHYWGQGIALAQPPLRFELKGVFAGIGTVTIAYESVGRSMAAEVFEFDSECRVIRARAHYASEG